MTEYEIIDKVVRTGMNTIEAVRWAIRQERKECKKIAMAVAGGGSVPSGDAIIWYPEATPEFMGKAINTRSQYRGGPKNA